MSVLLALEVVQTVQSISVEYACPQVGQIAKLEETERFTGAGTLAGVGFLRAPQALQVIGAGISLRSISPRVMSRELQQIEQMPTGLERQASQISKRLASRLCLLASNCVPQSLHMIMNALYPEGVRERSSSSAFSNQETRCSAWLQIASSLGRFPS